MQNEPTAGDSSQEPKIGKPIYSIITRLTVLYACVTFLILMLLGASVQSTLRATLIRTADRDQMNWVHGIQTRASRGNDVRDIFPPRMIARFQRPMSTPPTQSDILQSHLLPRLLDKNGQPILPGGPGVPGLPDPPLDPTVIAQAAQDAPGTAITTDIQVLGQPVRVVTAPLYQNGHMVAIFQNGRPLLDDERLEDLTSVMSDMRRFVLIAVIISTLTALILTGRAILPIRRITSAASRIGSNNLGERLPVSGRDEFADLATTFNGMLDRLEDGFRKMEQAYEQQRRFTGDASHELRTPLTIIKANASLALASSRTPEEYITALKTIDHAADRTNRLIQDLLLLARADAGQIEIDKRDILVDELISAAHSHVEMVTTEPGPKVIAEPVPELLSVKANTDMIVRILDNLVSNAARHTPADGEIHISAMVDPSDSKMVDIRVTDTGEGISPEHLPFLMDRFYRADKSRMRKLGGTGLGLAICKSIVDLHDGHITIDSEVGKGTTVDVFLPRAKSEVSYQPLNGENGATKIRTNGTTPKRTGPVRTKLPAGK